MTVEKLERVMWRLRFRNPGITRVPGIELRRAIMTEIGTDYRTYLANRKALITLGWITSDKKHIRLTGGELT